MKFPFAKATLLVCAAVFTWNCSSDSSSGLDPADASSSSAAIIADPSATLVATVTVGEIYSDMTVRDASGNVIGTFDSAAGTITLIDGSVVDTNGTVISGPTSSAATGDITSSATMGDVTSSASGDIASSSSEAVETVSSSSTAGFSGSGVMDPSGYEVPVLNSLLNNGATGWSSRYWDACKPHCSWPGNVDTTSEATYQASYTTARNCNIHDVEIPTYTLSYNVQQYWMGYQGTTSACSSDRGGGSSGAFACTDMAPVAVNDTLSYGFVAAPGSGNAGCGKCYHIQFNGGNHANDVKATHKALAGKHMIVMASNIGYDVEEGQFDMMVPGGGVGLYDALSTMVSGSNVQWGAQYGGFLTYCQQSLGYDNTVAKYQECVKDMCAAAFTGYDNLLKGCNWFADWYMAADNPTYNWEEIECPQYLIDKYKTTINTTKDTRIAWKDDWSTYTGGALDTLECLSDSYPQGCNK